MCSTCNNGNRYFFTTDNRNYMPWYRWGLWTTGKFGANLKAYIQQWIGWIGDRLRASEPASDTDKKNNEILVSLKLRRRRYNSAANATQINIRKKRRCYCDRKKDLKYYLKCSKSLLLYVPKEHSAKISLVPNVTLK